MVGFYAIYDMRIVWMKHNAMTLTEIGNRRPRSRRTIKNENKIIYDEMERKNSL